MYFWVELLSPATYWYGFGLYISTIIFIHVVTWYVITLVPC
jgi:hypothetical protein